jgi:hypothetical protein
MVPKSRTLKRSRPPLKPFKVHYDTFFFSEYAVNDCLAVTKLLMVLELDSTKEQLQQYNPFT